MTCKGGLAALFSLTVGFTLGTPALAQIPFERLPRRFDEGLPRLPENSNPALEQKKTEADKANQSGQFARAIDLADEVLRTNPSDPVAYYLRASARVELGVRTGDTKLIRDGISDSREAIRYDPKRSRMYYLPYLHGMKNLAALENRREHAETAITIATQVLNVPGLSNDDKANLLFQRAQSEAWLNKSDAAIADLQEALRAVPNHFGAIASLAEVLSAAGKTAEATQAYNKLVDSFPDNPLSYNNRGMFLQRQEKYDQAVIDFSRAVERDPNYFYAFTNRGFTFLQNDNPTAAEADFTQSLKINPQQPFVYNLLSLAKLAKGDVSGAIQEQRTAVSLNPKDAVALGDLGFLLFFSGDFAGAVQQFNAAQAIAPEFRHFLPWKIVALQRQGQGQNLNTQEPFSASLKKDIKERDWIDHLIAYLLGAETDQQLVIRAAEEKDAALKKDETCEGNYFIALVKAGSGQSSAAADAFQKAIATRSRHLSAYRGAQFALRKPSGTVNTTAGVVPVNPAK